MLLQSFEFLVRALISSLGFDHHFHRMHSISKHNTKRNTKRKKNGNGEEVPFSLSLLDWSSRLPLKNKNQKNTRALPTTGTRTIKPRKKEQEYVFTEENIDAIITSWEALDKAKGAPDQPMTLEPPRKRHPNEIYGKWCCSLVNCLQGSGRVFARHEFFYGDIDRAW